MDLVADTFGHGVTFAVYRDPFSGIFFIWHFLKYFAGFIQVKQNEYFTDPLYIFTFHQLTPASVYPIDVLDMIVWQVRENHICVRLMFNLFLVKFTCWRLYNRKVVCSLLVIYLILFGNTMFKSNFDLNVDNFYYTFYNF